MVRGVTKLKGLSETRTLQGSKKRSMPRLQSSSYLDLFLLGKEKDRLEKEMFILDKRKTRLQKKLDEIAVEMKKLEGAKTRGKRATSDESKKHPPKDWKTIAMTY